VRFLKGLAISDHQGGFYPPAKNTKEYPMGLAKFDIFGNINCLKSFCKIPSDLPPSANSGQVCQREERALPFFYDYYIVSKLRGIQKRGEKRSYKGMMNSILI